MMKIVEVILMKIKMKMIKMILDDFLNNNSNDKTSNIIFLIIKF